uniref:Uncharacterized protein n=1 Tax=Anguilla anguilla TaxID=7936 RepID=A0A0E9PGK8_ANGAN
MVVARKHRLKHTFEFSHHYPLDTLLML